MKIGAIIQARYGSSRLPGKVLMPLPFPDGKPLLKHIVDRLKSSKYINYIGIASSLRNENHAIEQFALKEQIDCYRGSEDNVLSRFIEITKKERLDYVIRLTGDNPLVALNELDDAIKLHIENQNEYTKSSGLPLGLNYEIVNAKSLLSLENEVLCNDDYEHVTTYFLKSSQIKKKIVHYELSSLGNMRCTIDYPSDFAMMSILMNYINLQSSDVISELKKVNLNSPWIFEINKNNFQKKQYQNIKDEFEDLKKVLKEYEFNYALSFLSAHFSDTDTKHTTNQ
jgi:spore coat polysaccharide biosynthesis protein SpsF